MGGSQSTRRLTVVNDEASGVIKLTTAVEERLMKEFAGGNDNSSNQATPPPAPPAAPAPEAIQAPPPPAPQVQEAPAAAQQKTIIQYVERESSLSSLRVKADKEKELAEAEAYWRKQFAKQEQEHSALAHLEMNAMVETGKKLSKMFGVEKRPPICLKERDLVLQCYKQNPDKPLLCSQIVKDFSKCVYSARTTPAAG